MIICVCKNINSAEVKDHLADGKTIDDISSELGLGTGCGRCLEYALGFAERHGEVQPISLAM